MASSLDSSSRDRRTSDSRVGVLNDLLRRISAMHDASEVQREFSNTMGAFSPWEGYISLSRRGLQRGEYKITGQILSEHDRAKGRLDPWKHWDHIPTYREGWLAQQIEQEVPKLIGDLRLEDDPVLGDALRHYRSAMVIPLFDSGEALNWSIALHSEPNAFSEKQVEEFLLRGNLIGRVTRNLVIQREIDQLNRQLSDQLQQIAAIQRSLLPDRTPAVAGLSIATSYLTSTHAGGDYFDFFEMEDGAFGTIIADVAGHGAGAATVVAIIQALLHSAYGGHTDPAESLFRVSRELVRKKIENNFVTAFFSVLDPARRTLAYSNAGHNRPLVRRADGSVEEILDAVSIPLGISTDIGYETAQFAVQPGDTIVLYTDGIVEAFAPRDPESGTREMFGKHRLIETLRDCTGEPDCVIDSIHNRLYQHTGSRSRDDDQTIVVLRITE